MQTIFQAVKEAVPLPEAARCCGLEANPGGMTRCPFHEGHTPSLRLPPDHYYCFGCHAHGDVIDLYARLGRLRPIEAARVLAELFHVEDPAVHLSAPKQYLEKNKSKEECQ